MDGGPEVPISRVLISGAVQVPRDRQRSAFIVSLMDITEGEDDEARPVLCGIDSMSDELGFFQSVREDVIPYRSATFQDLPAGVITDFALHAARKGQRRFRVMVRIVDADDHDRIFGFAWSSYSHTERDIGYEEWGEHQIKLERHVAEIGLAASIADGTFDREEFDVIGAFFKSRYRSREDREDLRTAVSAHLKETARALNDRTQTPGRLIRSAATVLRDDAAASAAAFELAVRVVAADEQIKKEEDQILATIASALQLDDDTVRSIRERVIRIEMFEDAGDEVILGMPPGLSHKEKLKWLTDDYNRWRGRVSHQDPAIVAEATSRLERIARLRDQLQRQS